MVYVVPGAVVMYVEAGKVDVICGNVDVMKMVEPSLTEV